MSSAIDMITLTLCHEQLFVGVYMGVPANTKHLYDICTMLDQRRRRLADVVQMLYKCFVFAWV